MYKKRNIGWKPNYKLEFSPFFSEPLNFVKIFKYFFYYPGLIFPWNLVFLLISVVLFYFLTPEIKNFNTFSFETFLYLFIRNLLLIIMIWGSLHYVLYKIKIQNNDYKYNAEFPKSNNKAFLFNNQTLDNIFLTIFSGVPIWTSYEYFAFYCFSNNLFQTVSLESNPIYSILLIIIFIPIFHELHFYLVHRFIHIKPIYKYIHYVHHKNINPGPWSGLAMHPVEHIFYFSGILIFLIVPSHPLIAVFFIIRASIGPALTHSGFDKILIRKNKYLEAGHYQHYLHHKYFNCNFGDIIIPIDKWFGTFNDGSMETTKKK